MQYNKIERLKRVLCPVDFKERIMQLNLLQLTEADRFYLKNYGIYTIKLMPEKFMLRIRVPAGRIARERLHRICRIANAYGLEILLTARAQIELHGLDASSVLAVWQELNAAGITTLQTLTDNFRNIVTDPYDGYSVYSKIEVFPLIEKMQALFLENPEWMGMLPRKFNTAISGTEALYTHFYGNDLYFALAQKKGKRGFNLYLGGKNSEPAKPADLFVLPEEVPGMFEAVAKVYRDFGLRGSRAKTRLYHLLSETGMEAFVEKVGSVYPHTLVSAGSSCIRKVPFTPYVKLDGGRFGYCHRTQFGRIDPVALEKIVDFAEKEVLEIRLGIDQNLYLLGLKERKVSWEAAVEGAAHVTACAGSSYCALSLWDIKTEAACLPLEKLERHQIQVGFSGCLKGCGRHRHCDIGLVGLRTNIFGATQKAARVYLGGQYSSGGAVARLLFHAVPLKHLEALFEVIIAVYEESGESDFETFSDRWLNGFSENFVTLWFLARLTLGQPLKLERIPESQLYRRLREEDGFPVYDGDEEYIESIRVMMHALWDD